MRPTEVFVSTVYLCGILPVALVVIWLLRKELITATDTEELMLMMLLVLLAAGFWFFTVPLALAIGALWLIAHGSRIVATGMIAIEQSGERRKERRELREKAQREIFADVDRMLAESNDDEIRAFMSKLTAERAA